MIKLPYAGKMYTIKRLSELSGVAPATLRDRLRRGYPVEKAVSYKLIDESVELFNEASWWEDWVGMPVSDLHKIYWKWCVSNEFTPLSVQSFSRHLLSMHPQLKSVPINQNGKCHRVIRIRS